MRYNKYGDYMKTVLKIIFATVGAVIALNGIALFFVSNVNFGSFLTVGFGIVIFLIALVTIGIIVHLIREKKRGRKCIGCPYSKECGGKCGSYKIEKDLQK